MNDASSTRAGDSASNAWTRSMAHAAQRGRQSVESNPIGQAGRQFIQRFGASFLVNFLVLLSAMLIAIAAIAVAFKFVVQPLRVQITSQAFASQLVGMAAGIQAMPIDARDAYLDRLGIFSGGKVSADDPRRWLLIEPKSEMVKLFFEDLRERLPAYSIAFTDTPRPLLWISIPVHEGRNRWIRFDLPPYSDMPAGMLVTVVLVMTGAASAAAAYLMLLLRRRLAWLVDALDGVDARSGFASSLPPTGANDDLLELDRHFKSMATRLAEAKSELALMMTGMSRDLQDLVARLRQVLPRTTTAPAAWNCLDEMTQVIGKFADFAQCDRMESMQLLDLNEVLAQVAQNQPATGYTVDMDLGGLPYVRLRPAAAHRIFWNVLNNALRHGRGPFELRSSLEDGWVVVRVLDRGDGVTDDELALLGRPFYRTEAGRSRGTGTGLGLAIARQETQAHGGVLRLARRPGGGMQVEVWLPPARLDEDTTADQ